MTKRKLNWIVFSMVLLLGVAVYAHGRPGDIDHGFGAGDPTNPRWPPAVAADGSIRAIDYYSTRSCCFPGGSNYQNFVSLDASGKLLSGKPPLTLAPARFRYLRTPLLATGNGDLLIPASPVNSTLFYDDGLIGSASQAGILRLGGDGAPITQFGNNGVAWLPVESWPLGVGELRAVAAMAEMPDGRIVAVVADSCASDPQSPFEGNSDQYGATYEATWGLPIHGEFCMVTRRLERARALLRLLPDGRMDTAFGTDGIVLLDSLGEITLLGLQAGGAVVLADRVGHVRRFGQDGRQIASLDLNLQDASGFATSDGSLVLAGRRPSSQQTLGIERLLPDLAPFSDGIGGAASISIDVGKDALGRDGVSIYPLEARGSPDDSQAYIAINLAALASRNYLCGGIVRIDLGREPALDRTFGKNGFSCLSRSGYAGGETHLVAHPVDGLLVHGPASHYMDRWAYGDDSFLLQKIQTANRESGPGRLSVQGMNQALWRDSGRVRLVVGRSGGRSGSVGATWRVQVGSNYGNATLAMTGIPTSGALQWQDGDDSDREIAFALPPVATDKQKSRVSELRVWLSDPAGGVLVDGNVTRISVLDADSALAQTNQGAPLPGVADSGGGALGVPAVLTLFIIAELARRRRLRASTGSIAAAAL